MEKMKFAPETIEKVIKVAMGRPTKYDPDTMIPTAIKILGRGDSQERLCAELAISEDTFYRWKKEHDAFSEAITLGLGLSRSIWIEMGENGLSEDKAQWAGYQMQMRNRFGWDKKETDKRKALKYLDPNASPMENIKHVLTALDDGIITAEEANFQTKMLSDHVKIEENGILRENYQKLEEQLLHYQALVRKYEDQLNIK